MVEEAPPAALDVAQDGPSRKFWHAREKQRCRIEDQLREYDLGRQNTPLDPSSWEDRYRHENSIRIEAARGIREMLSSSSRVKLRPVQNKSIVVISLMAVHITSEERFKKLRATLDMVAQQEPLQGDAELVVALSWYAPSPSLVTNVKALMDSLAKRRSRRRGSSLAGKCAAVQTGHHRLMWQCVSSYSSAGWPTSRRSSLRRMRQAPQPRVGGRLSTHRQQPLTGQEQTRGSSQVDEDELFDIPSLEDLLARIDAEFEQDAREASDVDFLERDFQGLPPRVVQHVFRRKHRCVVKRCLHDMSVPVIGDYRICVAEYVSHIDTLQPNSGALTVIVQQSERCSQFEHMRAALHAAEQALREKWSFKPGDEGKRSVWIMFGDDDDLWHPRRAKEFAHSISEHPSVDDVGIFVSLARANIEQGQCLPDEEIPSTQEQVDEFLQDGRATLLRDDDVCRNWRQQLQEVHQATESSLTLIDVPDDLELEYFDFYPRLRIVREFFDNTSSTVLANRFCDLRFNEFLRKYPLWGQELGLQVAFFEADCWMYFYAYKGVSEEGVAEIFERADDSIPTNAGVADGHVSSDIPVEDCDVNLAKENVTLFQSYDQSLTMAKISMFIAHFRYAMENKLIRMHRTTVDQPYFDCVVREMADKGFLNYLNATTADIVELDPKKARILANRMYLVFQRYAISMLDKLEINVIWTSPGDFSFAEKEPPDEKEGDDDDDASIIAEDAFSAAESADLDAELDSAAPSLAEPPPSKVLDRWARHTLANRIINHCVLTIEHDLPWKSITFKDTLQVFKAMGVDTESLLNVFGVQCHEREQRQEIYKIIRHFAAYENIVEESMTISDVEKLFQHMMKIKAIQHDDLMRRFALNDLKPTLGLRESSLSAALKMFCTRSRRGKAEFQAAPNSMSFSEVRELLRILKITEEEFVSYFCDTECPHNEAELGQWVRQALVGTIIGEMKETKLSLRALYWLLHFLELKPETFVARVKRGGSFPDEMFIEDIQDVTTGYFRLKHAVGNNSWPSKVYLAEDLRTEQKVAFKFPATEVEVETIRHLQELAPDCICWPELLDWGQTTENPIGTQYYLATQLLGSSLDEVFERLEGHPEQAKLGAVKIIGRILLRRLEALHCCGYVHCYICPENILLGSSDSSDLDKTSFYLTNFRYARQFPHGGDAPGDHGNMLYSSIRSAKGGERSPADDMEALGWTLVTGLLGFLPWFQAVLEFLGLKKSLQELKINKFLKELREQKMEFIQRGYGFVGDGDRKSVV